MLASSLYQGMKTQQMAFECRWQKRLCSVAVRDHENTVERLSGHITFAASLPVSSVISLKWSAGADTGSGEDH